MERDLEIPHRSWETDGNLACGWERATSRAPCPNGRWSCKCAKCTTTRREQLVRREPQVNHRDHRSRSQSQPMMQQIPEQYTAHKLFTPLRHLQRPFALLNQPFVVVLSTQFDCAMHRMDRRGSLYALGTKPISSASSWLRSSQIRLSRT